MRTKRPAAAACKRMGRLYRMPGMFGGTAYHRRQATRVNDKLHNKWNWMWNGTMFVSFAKVTDQLYAKVCFMLCKWHTLLIIATSRYSSVVPCPNWAIWKRLRVNYSHCLASHLQLLGLPFKQVLDNNGSIIVVACSYMSFVWWVSTNSNYPIR